MRLFSQSPPEPLSDIDRYAAEFELLRTEDGNRLRRYAEYRKECEATRGVDLDQAQPGSSRDYGRIKVKDGERLRHRFRFPLSQALTVKHAHRIAGQLPDAVVDRPEETAEQRFRSDTMEKMWWSVVRASGGDTEFGDAAWDSSQVGAAAFDIYWDVRDQTPKFRAVDPGNCIVVKGLSDPHDFERVYRWWYVTSATLAETYEGKGFRDQIVSLHDCRENAYEIVQMCNRERTVTFLVNGPRTIGLEEKTHGYGFTPYVVIPNLGPYRKVWGWADYEFVREVDRYINLALGREADILQMVANGAVQAKGTTLSNHQIQKALMEGGVLPMKRDGAIEPVATPEMPGFEEGHIQRLFDIFERVGFAPPAAWGAIGASSGSDRGLQLQPMVELTAMKQKNWSKGLSRLGEMAFRMIEGKQVGKANFYGTSRRGSRTSTFNFAIDASQAGTVETPVPSTDGGEQIIDAPANPRDLFAGNHSIRFVWQTRIDVDDPAFVASEINKFAQGVQSLRTTLERLGVEAPEDEIKLIEQEAEEHPWLRQGMIKLLELQVAAQEGGTPGGQGAGGGAPFDGAAAIDAALGQMGQKDGAALDTDALTGALPGGVGQLYGGA